jgi:DNA-directed RNA polymerase specialized sigma subunit|nr:MAG TPA: Protein of unknown function (DUF1492) [Caudoviricetes sp.]
MTAKEYLTKLILIAEEISRKQQRLETLRDVALNTTADFSSEFVQHTREKNPLENIMAKIVDLSREIDSNLDMFIDLKAEVWEQLDKLSDERHKRILWLKYAERRTWSYIASNIYLTRRHVMRLHKVALDNFDTILELQKCHSMSP